MEVPNYVPRSYHCDSCNDRHPVFIGNEHDLARFRDKFVVKCGGHYIARWVSNHRVMVPLVPPVAVPLYRRHYPRRNALVALLDPPAPRAPAPQPPAIVNRPIPRRVTISLEMQNDHFTYRTADVLRGEFSIALLDAEALQALHHGDLLPNSLQVREGDQYTYLGDRTIALAPHIGHVSLRGRSRRFAYRFARDMADAFATFETYCGLHPEASPIDAFHYAFPDIDWPGENAFFDAQLDWQTVTPQLRRDCANNRYTDDFLWHRVRGAALEHHRLTSLRGLDGAAATSAAAETSAAAAAHAVKKEPGAAPNPLKRKRRDSSPAANGKPGRGAATVYIVIDSDDEDAVIEID